MTTQLPVAACLTAAIVLAGRSGPPPIAGNDPGFSVQQATTKGASPELPLVLKWVREWAAAVEQHEIGSFDQHAVRVAGWGPADVQVFVGQMPGVLKFATSHGGKGLDIRGELVTGERLQGALGLTDDEWRTGNVTRLVRRGALLHADIARRGAGSASGVWGAVPENAGPDAPFEVVTVNDGLVGGPAALAGQWRFGRFLLQWVRPPASRDPVVIAWYRGAAAFLQHMHASADVEWHLHAARQVLPDDAVIAFHEGVLHEVFASPTAQAVLQAGPPRKGLFFKFGAPDGELRRARDALRRALELDRQFLEARLHVGRVLGQLGSHEEAAGELRAVVQATRDLLLEYYARLFLGREEEALGRLDAARESYQAAAALYPQAQSPRLALAQLSWRRGHRPAARDEILGALASAGGDPLDPADPWWDYLYSPGRHAEAFFEEAGRACVEGERR